MQIGLHVSAAGDLSLAPKRAKNLNCECFQFFSRSPRGGAAKTITTEQAAHFKDESKKYKMHSYIHTPYYINFASSSKRIYEGSIEVVKDELDRGSQLGVNGLMTHLGSAKDLGRSKAIQQLIGGLAKMLKNYQGSTKFLVEMAAGAGQIMGDSFEEIAQIIFSDKLKKHQIGVCLDTCHIFASGYDLRNQVATKNTFKQFDKIIGIKHLKLIHLNDSQNDFGSRKDRHANIGQGKIPLESFKTVADLANKHNIDLILESPGSDSDQKKDVELLKKLRGKSATKS